MLMSLIGRGQDGAGGLDSDSQSKVGLGSIRRPVIGLALGGGAARGFAHIGILKTMLAHGIVPNVVVGTSLFQILFVTMAATMMHALTTEAVDIVLAGLLLLGSVTGAQVGTRIAQLAKPDVLRLLLAGTVLAVALRMAFGLGVRPDEVYSVLPL